LDGKQFLPPFTEKVAPKLPDIRRAGLNLTCSAGRQNNASTPSRLLNDGSGQSFGLTPCSRTLNLSSARVRTKRMVSGWRCGVILVDEAGGTGERVEDKAGDQQTKVKERVADSEALAFFDSFAQSQEVASGPD
jgi:hypothetical protein